MISFLRRYFVDSWIGRILAGVLFLAFVSWGIGDIFTSMAEDPNTVAKVGSQKIGTRDFAAALQAEMPRLARQIGAPDAAHVPPMLRQQMANEILQRLIGQAQVIEAARAYGISVSDEAVRNEIFAMPYFQGKTGGFDRQVFNNALAGAGMTENRLIALVRNDLTGRAVMEAVSSGAHVPDILVNRTYAHETATSVLDVVRVPFAAVPAPGAPDEATLKRFFGNHPWMFQSPEYRHARIIVLSPDTVASRNPPGDDELRRLYDARKDHFNQPELRSVQIVTMADQAAAQAIATLWKGGAEWLQIQAASKDASAVEIDDARPSLLPSADLRKLVFAAAQNRVVGPEKTDTGWVVFRVTKVTPPRAVSFDDARAELAGDISKSRAPAIVSASVPKLQDAIAGGGLEAIPSDLGAAAASGFLDAKGLTREGEPAPLPASGALRDELVAHIFAQDKGAPPQLVEARSPSAQPGQATTSLGWYAVSVDDVAPARPLSFEEARSRVLAAWETETRQHEANVAATALYVQAGRSDGGVAAVAPAGSDLRRSVMVSRVRQGDASLPGNLLPVIFMTPAGQTVMGQDDAGFVVATVTAVQHPDPQADSLGIGRVRDGLTESLAGDMSSAFILSLGERDKPKIMQAGFRAALNEAGFGDGS